MKVISVSRFTDQCLTALEQLDPDGTVITKRGKPTAKLIPPGTDSECLIGSLGDKIKIRGDILSTSVRWHPES